MSDATHSEQGPDTGKAETTKYHKELQLGEDQQPSPEENTKQKKQMNDEDRKNEKSKQLTTVSERLQRIE